MKTVLLTGATGVIGSELAPRFLHEKDCRVGLLVRARSPEHLRERLDPLADFWRMDAEELLGSGRLELLAGDVCQPKMGLDEDVYGRLVRSVTHVVHCAGNVKLNQPLEAARVHAVDSARHVLDLARQCRQSGQLVKLDVLSTVGVAGRQWGVIPEEPLREPREFHNTYEAAKSEAERLLVDAISEGLPLTIHRPSMVVGSSHDGRILQFQIFYYLCEFLSGQATWGIVPDTGGAVLDVVPVDYVARALYVAHGDRDSVGRILHLCSGPQWAVRLVHLAEVARRIAGQHGARLPRLRRQPLERFRRLVALARQVTWGRTRRLLGNLPYFLTYLDEEQYFGCARTHPYLEAHGLALPRPDDYLTPVLEYYYSRRGR